VKEFYESKLKAAGYETEVTSYTGGTGEVNTVSATR